MTLSANATSLRMPGWASGRADISAAGLARLVFTLALGGCALLPAGYLLWAALPVLFDGGWLAHFASTTLPHQARTSLWVGLEAAVVAFAVGALPAVAVLGLDFCWVSVFIVVELLVVVFEAYRIGRSST